MPNSSAGIVGETTGRHGESVGSASASAPAASRLNSRGALPDVLVDARAIRQARPDEAGDVQRAYKIDTALADPLRHLHGSLVKDQPTSLAQRNRCVRGGRQNCWRGFLSDSCSPMATRICAKRRSSSR